MEHLFLIVTILPAVSGVLLLADFFMWEAKGTKTAGQVENFSGKKDKGKPLPVVSFITEGGPVSAAAVRIDQLMYLLSRPQPGDAIDIIYTQAPEQPPQVRVYGFLNAAGGVLMLLPFIVMLAWVLGRALVFTQSLFFLVFVLVIIGGVVFLKLVQRLY